MNALKFVKALFPARVYQEGGNGIDVFIEFKKKTTKKNFLLGIRITAPSIKAIYKGRLVCIIACSANDRPADKSFL